MKLIVIILLLLLGIAAMIVAAWFVVELRSYDPPDGTTIEYPDEHSPEQLDFDKTLKELNLRKFINEN